MELEQRLRSSQRLRRLLVICLKGTFITLGLVVLLAFLHALSSDAILVAPIVALGGVLLVFSIASIGLGLAYSWGTYPLHRRVIMFVVGITLITLIAHLYVIGSPPASDVRAPVSGQIGTQLLSSDKGDSGNPLVTVTSSLSGQRLSVTVTASGSSAIVNLNLKANSQLTGAGFAPGPNFSSPLRPGSSVTGTWTATPPATNISLSYQSLNCYKTSSPPEYGCIMDEIFYVPEGMAVLQGQVCTAGNGATSYCHLEHPPLVPELLAAGMAVFGEFNVVGWRIMPVLMGTFSLPLLFGIAWKVSGSKKIAIISTLLLSLDVMFFSQSSAALLDIPEIFFALAAYFAYFADLKLWKFDRYVISAILLGLAGLAKETAIFLALALVTYIMIFDGGSRWKRFEGVLKVVLVVGLVFVAGMQAYDSALTTMPTPGGTGCQLNSPNFLGQIDYIFCYGSELIAAHQSCITAGYWCKFHNDPSGTPILPTDWTIYYSPVEYYATSVSVCPNSVNGVCQGGTYSYVALAYYGVTNFLETWTVYVWIPLVGYSLYRFLRAKQPSLEQFGFGTPTSQAAGMPGELRLAAFALILFAWSYLPYLGLLAVERVTYPFYFLPAVPAVATGCAYWLTRDWFPKWLRWIYLIMVFVFFFVYFPYKGFLPDWLRVLIGH